jgi:hypothetical protein
VPSLLRIALALIAIPQLALTASFTPLGFFNPSALSNDGRIVVGGLNDATGSSEVVRWSREGGIEVIGRPGGALSATATGVSEDGSILVGTLSSATPDGTETAVCRWSQSDGFDLIPELDAHTDPIISADGRVITDGRALWIAGAVDRLPVPGVVGLSADGSVVAGYTGITRNGVYAPLTLSPL